MYFVTSKRPGYVLFCMTPSGRAAIGLSEEQLVRLFERAPNGDWTVLREWASADLSHTDLLLVLGEHDEPPAARDLLALVPSR
jgi:hypothetical protein